MTTREEEIEAKAWALFTHQQGPDYTMIRCLEYAQAAVHERDQWRAARQPAPEAEQPTPTPRIEVLSEEWVDEASDAVVDELLDIGCRTLGISLTATTEKGQSYAYDRASAKRHVAQALRQHAATLKAQQRGEVRDGA